jgi:hypothetical protein
MEMDVDLIRTILLIHTIALIILALIVYYQGRRLNAATRVIRTFTAYDIYAARQAAARNMTGEDTK